MVRGTSRRVIVVDSPDTELFEQAIFIVRNDAVNRNGVTAQRLVDEACRVARTCGRTATCPAQHSAARLPRAVGLRGRGWHRACVAFEHTHLISCFSSDLRCGRSAVPHFFARKCKF